jgi:hypothetical protein
MPYHNGSRKTWVVTLPMRDGRRKRVSTGTSHRPTAMRFERMIRDLGPSGSREWDLLDRVADGSLTIGVLYDHWNSGSLSALRESLEDVDIEPFLEPFLTRHRDRVSLGTIETYRQKLRLLMPQNEKFMRSSFTVARLDSFITDYDGRHPPVGSLNVVTVFL